MPGNRSFPFRYLAISSEKRCPEPVCRRINRLYRLGVPAVQFREKKLCDSRKNDLLGRLHRPPDARLIINSRPDLAQIHEADGIHLATRALPAVTCRKITGDEVLVGLSTHDLTEVRNAGRLGVDYITFGPIFPTASKPGLPREECQGVSGLRKAVKNTPLPVFALGGVTPENIESCLRAGAHGAAGIGALFGPEDPAENWRRIEKVLNSN